MAIAPVHAHARQERHLDLQRRLQVQLLHSTRRATPQRLGAPLRRNQHHHHLQMDGHARTRRNPKQNHERAPPRPPGEIPLGSPPQPRRRGPKLGPPLEQRQNATKWVHILHQGQTRNKHFPSFTSPGGVQPNDPQHRQLGPRKNPKFGEGDLLPVAVSAALSKQGLEHGRDVRRDSV